MRYRQQTTDRTGRLVLMVHFDLGYLFSGNCKNSGNICLLKSKLEINVRNVNESISLGISASMNPHSSLRAKSKSLLDLLVLLHKLV